MKVERLRAVRKVLKRNYARATKRSLEAAHWWDELRVVETALRDQGEHIRRTVK